MTCLFWWVSESGPMEGQRRPGETLLKQRHRTSETSSVKFRPARRVEDTHPPQLVAGKCSFVLVSLRPLGSI